METTTPPWNAVIAAIAPSPTPPAAPTSLLGMAAGASPSGSVLDETTQTTGTSFDERAAAAPASTTTREHGWVKNDVPTLNIVSEGSELPEEQQFHRVISLTHNPHDEPTPSTSAAPHEILISPSLVAPRSTSTPEPPSTTYNHSSSTSSTPPPAISALRSDPIRRPSPLKQELYDDGNISEPSFVIEEEISVQLVVAAPITSTCTAAAEAAITPARVATLKEQVVGKDSGGYAQSPCGETDTSSLFPFHPLYTNHAITQSPNSNDHDDLSLIMNERGSFLLPSDDSLAPTPIKKNKRGELSEILEDEEEEERSANLSQLLKGWREGSPLSINWGSELGISTRTLGAQEVGDARTPSRLGTVEVFASTTKESIMTSPTPVTPAQADESMMDRSKIDDVEELFENLAEQGKGSGGGGVEHGVENESMLSLLGERDESIGEEMVGSVAREPTPIPLPQTRVQETPADHSITTLEHVQGTWSQLLTAPLASRPVEQEKRVEDESILSFEMMRDETIGVIEGQLVESPLAIAIESPTGKAGAGAFMASPLGTPEGVRTVRPLSPAARESTPRSKTVAEVPLSTTMAKTVPTPSRGLERLRNKMVALRLGALQTQNQAGVPLGNPIPSTAAESTHKSEPDALPTPSTPVRRPRLSSTILQTPIGSSAAALRLEKYRAINTPKTVGRDEVVAITLPTAEEGKGKNEVGMSAPRTLSTTMTTTPMRTVSTLDASAKRHKRSETIQLTSSAGKSLFSPAAGSRTVAGPERGVGTSPLVRMAVAGDRRRSLIATSTAVPSPVKMRSLREGAAEEARPVRSSITSTATTGRVGTGAGRIGSTTSTTATRQIPSVRSSTYSTTPSRVSLLTGGRPTPRIPTTTTTTTTLLPNCNDQNVAPARSITRPSTTSTTSSSLLPLRSSALLKTRPTFQPRVLKPLVSSRKPSSMTSTSVGDKIATGTRPRFGLGPLPARSTTIGTGPAGASGGSAAVAGVGARMTTAVTSTRKTLAPVAGARSAVGSRGALG
ncbi:BZ3500_MvSof-1268-A1-R1_Chr5-1g07620 [Microbotryum saponariae]|uniref:BZ3500_MvSof-1268-A1-R1_Chr5-1g07620 protein n=1 Tax=Microbotryum saponariae TaxID=289078 RepID=A0A2X0KGK7_9BASI|nr:BZ3500_MvSof-1268-A1-R1_Chr5-1g07620 [Microbotryum saponariae]SDA05491.1 BZ3501_MvSof-1269-A2-R1_Chr5-2g07444 [Microbotryum saponariae]